MRVQLAQQAQEILGTSDLVMITERVDDVALLIGQMVKMGLPEVLDRVWSKYSNAAFFKAFRPVLTLSPIFRGTGRVLPLEMLGWRGRLQGLRRRDEQKTFTLGRRS
jgi:hypothetical protein